MEVLYKLTSPTNKVYIGRAVDFEKRMIGHKSAAYSKKLNTSLYKAVRKYGWDNFKKEIICEVEAGTAQKLEEELIKAHDSVRKGYNDTYLGGGGDNWKDRRDTDEYMEWIAKMKIVNQTNRMHGKNHSSQTKKLQKEKAKGRYSLEWFIDRNGKEDGEKMYEERRVWLKSRSLKKDSNGRFVKSNI